MNEKRKEKNVKLEHIVRYYDRPSVFYNTKDKKNDIQE